MPLCAQASRYLLYNTNNIQFFCAREPQRPRPPPSPTNERRSPSAASPLAGSTASSTTDAAGPGMITPCLPLSTLYSCATVGHTSCGLPHQRRPRQHIVQLCHSRSLIMWATFCRRAEVRSSLRCTQLCSPPKLCTVNPARTHRSHRIHRRPPALALTPLNR